MGRKKGVCGKKRIQQLAVDKNSIYTAQNIPELKRSATPNDFEENPQIQGTAQHLHCSSEVIIEATEIEIDSSLDANKIEFDAPLIVVDFHEEHSAPMISEQCLNDDCNGLSMQVNKLKEKHKKLKNKIKEFKDATNNTQKALEKLTKVMKKYKKIKKQNEELKNANLRLQNSLTSNLMLVQEIPFTEIEGLPNNDRLLKFSTEAGDSDYLFTKFLMCTLWPAGFLRRSVTGRRSNNPAGSSKSGISEPFVMRTPLEKEKVDYIKDRLFERRMHMRDGPAVSSRKAQGGNRLMTRVIANSLRDATR
ncbi:uncharacterized protein LOC129730914 [Wyeomyia smithii]|uniref:uncharacterized protein LOC129730914 n=1 Tax=Wyeomyia smithii TaxID=174621 RepID=UPI0024680B87|nr:uncharacterized protein LOC129730914 [Wyeomyia smithii]